MIELNVKLQTKTIAEKVSEGIVPQIYIGGHMLTTGAQHMRNIEKEAAKLLGYKPYAPHEDEEINDKTNQTQEDNDGLAEKIFKKDTQAMIDSDVLVFEVDNGNVGTSCEIAQFAMLKALAPYTTDPTIKALANKPVFFHCTDIRHTDIPEVGMRRSYSFNQYLIGTILALNPKGIQSWSEIEEELVALKSFN